MSKRYCKVCSAALSESNKGKFCSDVHKRQGLYSHLFDKAVKVFYPVQKYNVTICHYLGHLCNDNKCVGEEYYAAVYEKNINNSNAIFTLSAKTFEEAIEKLLEKSV